MNFLKKVITILTLGFCTLSVQASPFSISEQQINQYLSEKARLMTSSVSQDYFLWITH